MDSENKDPDKRGFHLSGDANAISKVDLSDSHNVTNIYNGAVAEEKLLADRKKSYEIFCRHFIQNGNISRTVRDLLEDKARELDLDPSVTDEIELRVKEKSALSKVLSLSDQSLLDDVKAGIRDNSGNLRNLAESLRLLVERVDNEEVQFYTYLVCAVENPSQCIRLYEHRSYDSYWMRFWASMAYKRLGKDASQTMSALDVSEYPMGNTLLLICANRLYDYFVNNAEANSLNASVAQLKECHSYSEWLDGFMMTLKYMVGNRNQTLSLSNSKECNFYLRLFEVKAQSKPSPTPIPQPVSPSFNSSAAANAKISDEVCDKIDKKFQDALSRAVDEIHQNTVRMTAQNAQRPVYTNPQTPAYQPSSTSQTGAGQSKFWRVVAAVAVALFVFWFATKDKKEISEPATPVVAEETTAPVETATSAKSTIGSRQTTVSNSSSTRKNQTTTATKSRETTVTSTQSSSSSSVVNSTVEASSGNAASTTTATAPVELTASEYLQKGKSALRSFKDRQALSYFNQAASKGSVEAYRYIGSIYYNGGNDTDKNYSMAFAAYQRAASANDVESQYWLGVMYRNGQGCDKSISNARTWLSKAANQGYEKARIALERL